MTKRFPVLLASLLAVSSVSAPLQVLAQEAQPLDRIAAVVDEDVILQSELQRAIANIKAQYAGRENQLPPEDVLSRQVLERLVLVKLQVARAQGSGIRVSDQELNQAMNSIAQQNGSNLDALRQRLAHDGIDFNDFRASVRDEITVQRLRQSFAQSRISVSEGEVDAALKQQATVGNQYHLAHILIALPDGANADQIATGQKKADGVKTLLDKGELDFNAAAVRYSDSPNALEGGDLGWRSLDEIPQAFAQMMEKMKPGEVVGPIRGPSGFQLLKLVEVRDASSAAAGEHTVTEFHGRHILVRVDDHQTDAAAKAKIDTLRARIAGGAEFQTVAKESSEDNNSKGQGGDLGWFPADAFGPAFGQQVEGLQDGGVSQPFRTDAGWHIVQRVATRQTDVTTDNQRAQVRETIGRRKLEDEYNRFLQELRGEAYVSFRSGDRAENTATPPQS
ncbi:molecular chaperone SurA [Stenotrophomonas maltophilia]|jgi:peptidyl-prolyl cis-trans isomerase SurA|uniref:Chaperone SurA n=2 Tax=Gammaproteobacteria TaxID=1236 RepID=A0AA41CDG9_STEMA|nr:MULTISPECIES: peptidylprolyl isomerase [unclassified Stenotrophomonas]AWB77115.1 molecular chaperone SurA [Stenotrophomonas maltophilia]KDE90108.1 molecular chaperone SurA [Stenotrophomonas maltophilia M30]MBF9139547.1 peptidylprolyl isomerase [Stenotrophomonas sp. 232]MCR1820581.1 peptidylprolyl isomerase [Stenotrophomonas muris]MDQ7297172.1 peptidylprolyl isomerase [Stenotrophomonas sp. Sm2017]HDN7839782.1 peptidylprolyl isomerase [Klebsiella pneumoniae]